VERNAKILTQKRPSESRFKTATRYHVPPAPYSLYLLSDRALEVVEDASAKMLWRREGRDVHDFQMDPAGVARVTWNDPSGIVSVDVDIRGPTLNLKGLGALGESAARSALLSKIDGLGVKVEERGTQFTDVELQAAWDILQTWPDPNMSLIGALQSHGLPGLTLVKDLAIERAELVDEKVQIPGGIVPSARSQRSAITHEIGHALFAAAGLKLPSELGDAKPEHVTAVAQQLLQESSQGLIDEQRIGDPLKPRTQEDWEQSLSMNKELNEIWAALHHRFAILDPERTGDIRGLDVADESRYLFNVEGDIPGHGFDNVNEFVASFIASSRQFESRMVGTIRYSGSQRLATLYRDLWNLVNENISTLGSSNPYDDLINRR
jgi:hypothetical protein